MNKLFAIAFTCIYLLLSVGVVKSTHYCMGRAKSTAIFSYEAKKCACSLFSPENSCCHDEHEVIQIKDFQALTSISLPDLPGLFLISEALVSSVSQEVIGKTNIYNCFSEYIPPPVPIYKLNCSFLFYDDPNAAG